MPTHWASDDLDAIVFDNIRYYLANGQKPTRSWDEVPDDVKRTFERLGIPEQERKFLAGVEAQFDSRGRLLQHQEGRRRAGRHFHRPTEGLHEHPEIFRKWFGKVIPTGDNKFCALNQRRLQRRLVHLCAAGREGETSAPGLLPHQRGKLRPVRADPHHRRRRRAR